MRPLRILVAGRLATASGQGGLAWIVLQYMLGLERLGHRVLFIESFDEPLLDRAETAYAVSILRQYSLEGAVIRHGSRECAGMEWADLAKEARRADILLNISGALDEPELSAKIPIRVYVDIDPVFTQIWHVQGQAVNLDGHTHHATIGRLPRTVPDAGRRWIVTDPPVALEHWPPTTPNDTKAFTTVANLRGYGSVEHEGRVYGQKVHSLRRIIDLPKRTDQLLELAMAVHPDEKKDLESLAENGWRLVDPARRTETPTAYRHYIQGSKAELGIAKAGYVDSCCGWFSDRSVCYLASGRPVVAQSTGFEQYLPTGKGLLSFKSSEEAAEAIEKVRADYRYHAREARKLAEEHFESGKVLSKLLTDVGAS